MTANQCHLCRNSIGPEFKNEYFKINNLIYCSIDCIREDIKDLKKEVRTQASNCSGVCKNNKIQKPVQSKSKKRSRK